VEAIQQHENEPAREPKLHKFQIKLRKLRVPLNGDQYKEIWMLRVPVNRDQYKEIWILKFMKQNENNGEQRSVGYQGQLCFPDHICVLIWKGDTTDLLEVQEG
jgi:hypothetical protein